MRATWLLPLLAGGCTTLLGIDGDYQLAPGARGGGGGAAGGPSICPADMIAHEASSQARFCIDRTEVTEAAYQDFIASGEVPPLDQAHCAGDASFHPGSSAAADGPVTEVDVCDAHAYCTWAGKELCGSPGGGEAGEPAQRSSSAWYAACAGDALATFPYGDAHEEGACVDASYGVSAPVAVGEASACATPLGVVDLVGNVAEWEHSCAHAVHCLVRGGSFESDDAAARCAGAVGMKWDDISGGVGFRCCVPLP